MFINTCLWCKKDAKKTKENMSHEICNVVLNFKIHPFWKREATLISLDIMGSNIIKNCVVFCKVTLD